MNKIEKLINELCPEGVEFKELGTVLKYQQPTKYIVKSTQYDESYRTPVLTAGQSFLLGYTNETEGIYKATNLNPVIIFDDFTTSFHWVDFDFKIKSSAMKIISLKNGTNNIFRYIYYAMKCINYYPQDHARQWISKYSLFKIPIPPLPIQEEIVSILDKFTLLEAELEAELEARKTQYEHYRDELLSFGDDVEFKELRNVLKYEQPTKYIVKSTQYDESYATPVLTAGQSFLLGYTNETEGIYKVNKLNPVIIFDDFTTSFHWVDFDFKIKSSAMKIISLIDESENIFRYVYYAMKCINYFPQDHARQWISKYSLFKIPVPPLQEQERIVAILDKFDALVNDISVGLPAEIKARRKQYEYYRNKLLTFKEVK